MGPTTHSSAPVQCSAAAPAPSQYTCAGLAPVAQPPPPTDGCCGPHHTLLRSRTVLCCGPCSFTVHFRGPRPCSSAPSDGQVLWTLPRTPPLPYSTLLHCNPWLRPLRRFSPPPLRRSGGKRQPLPRPISRLLSPMLHCSPWLRSPRRFSPPPLRRSGGKRQPLPRPISRLVSPMLHCSPRIRPPRVFTPPPFAPVAPSARNGHTTPRSYAELTQMRISTFKTGAFETRRLYLRSSQVHLRPRRLYLRPRPLYLHRSPLCLQSTAARLWGNSTSVFYSLRLRLTLAVSTPVVPFRSTHHSVCIV